MVAPAVLFGVAIPAMVYALTRMGAALTIAGIGMGADGGARLTVAILPALEWLAAKGQVVGKI